MGAVHIGLDIGTTNITMVVLDLEQQSVPSSRSIPNVRYQTGESYAYAQDPVAIEQAVRSLLAQVKQPIGSLCVTGQVHGIVYHDAAGKAVSPLYTWLDRRAMEAIDGVDSQHLLYEKTGVLLPSGYGLLAHYANRRLGKVPEESTGFCGILEYVTGRLIGSVLDRSDPSCLGPFGAFDPVASHFNSNVLQEVFGSTEPRFLDSCTPFALAGYTPEGIPVAYPVGDNQAGFFGMVSDWQHSVLVSMGTSGQLSLFSTDSNCPSSMELRPFLGEGFLHVGATLTAGKAYETVQRFIASTIRSAGMDISDEAVFTLMKQTGQTEGKPGALQIDTRLNGSRKDPAVRGSIRGIDLDNLTLGNLVIGTIDGIVDELHQFSTESGERFAKMQRIIATGSSVRKNPLFKDALGRAFRLPTTIAEVDDGAGFGAALIAAVATRALGRNESRSLVGKLLGT
ncbi:MAG: sedoheptulokinase [Sphaerochaeta sp.]|uniref:sedoheptulokinase n=1 Tax=Sphaerochaeta sp. TaxID=1972642 RepID=UPI002FCA84B9